LGAGLGSLFSQKIQAIFARRTFAGFLVYAAARLWVK